MYTPFSDIPCGFIEFQSFCQRCFESLELKQVKIGRNQWQLGAAKLLEILGGSAFKWYHVLGEMSNFWALKFEIPNLLGITPPLFTQSSPIFHPFFPSFSKGIHRFTGQPVPSKTPWRTPRTPWRTPRTPRKARKARRRRGRRSNGAWRCQWCHGMTGMTGMVPIISHHCWQSCIYIYICIGNYICIYDCILYNYTYSFVIMLYYILYNYTITSLVINSRYIKRKIPIDSPQCKEQWFAPHSWTARSRARCRASSRAAKIHVRTGDARGACHTWRGTLPRWWRTQGLRGQKSGQRGQSHG